MYCVRCGVKLQDGVRCCPLCGTKVMLPDVIPVAPHNYPERFPKENRQERALITGAITAFLCVAAIVSFLVCMKAFGRVEWSGYVMLGAAFAWIVGVLPLLPLPKGTRDPYVLVPIDFAAAGGLLLYISAKTGGHWFLSFAFPLTVSCCLLVLLFMTLYRYIRKGRMYVTGVLLVTMGGYAMLIELFQSLTFGSPMFLWSLYCAAAFGLPGIFLLIAAAIPPMRAYIERKFFY